MKAYSKLFLVFVALGAFTHHVFAERLNILFIVSEDNGPELGCYGAPVRTPHLDRLAEEGTLF